MEQVEERVRELEQGKKALQSLDGNKVLMVIKFHPHEVGYRRSPGRDCCLLR